MTKREIAEMIFERVLGDPKYTSSNLEYADLAEATTKVFKRHVIGEIVAILQEAEDDNRPSRDHA